MTHHTTAPLYSRNRVTDCTFLVPSSDSTMSSHFLVPLEVYEYVCDRAQQFGLQSLNRTPGHRILMTAPQTFTHITQYGGSSSTSSSAGPQQSSKYLCSTVIAFVPSSQSDIGKIVADFTTLNRSSTVAELIAFADRHGFKKLPRVFVLLCVLYLMCMSF